MANKIQLRRDTTDNWERVNPVLSAGEPALDITTNQIKYGDGLTAWNDLPYATTGGSGDGYTGSSGTGYTGSSITGYTGSVGTGYTGSASEVIGYTGSASTAVGYTGSKGADGGFGGASFDYYYSQAVIDTVPGPGPGDGYIAFNNLSFDISNIMRISYIDKSAVSVQSFLQTVDDSTSAIKGHFSVTDKNNSDVYAIFSITGLHSEHTDHFDIPVAHITGQTTFNDLTEVTVTFARTGDVGDPGPPGYTGSASEVIGYTGSASEVVGYTGSASEIIGYTGSASNMAYQGPYNTSNSYPEGSIVTYNGYSFIATTDVPYFTMDDSILPNTVANNAYWDMFASKGRQPFYMRGEWVSGYGYETDDVVFDTSDNHYYIVQGGSYYNTVPPSQQYGGSNSWRRFYITSEIGYTGSASEVIGYTGSEGVGYTGSASEVIGYTGSASEVIGYTGSASEVIGYTGSASEVIGYTGSASTAVGYTGSIGYTGSTIPIYGSFWDNDVVQANLSVGANISISNVYANSGLYVSNDGQITITTDGIYRIDYSLQFQNTDNQQNNVFVWLRKNGVSIPNSSTYFTVPAKGSHNGYLCAVSPFLDSTVNAGDFYQISWSADDTHIYLQGISNGGPAPASPATIVTVTKI